ncbi:hypothetical protein EF903_04605 [Streptomyces sp. WAC05292]|uniref:tetratricopeptide repeat protein n=1 Tax=Streptomyces sp. WAC05292 TaxID=2487418 RepID=UPI000F740D5B|nr:tetratricopeptide repeat protein [Streptomyces sp. WAC05292]RSS95577.1 hypothetical protein EF903_04605 [Streptomyces sp. WAC05292]
MEPRHIWIKAGRAAQRRAAAASSATNVLGFHDCHRNIRGPYGGCADFLRSIAPAVRERNPRLFSRHETALLAAAPELREITAPRRETLLDTASADERIRFHPRGRTLRIAHGIADFLEALTAGRDGPAAAVFFDNADHADQTTVELLGVLLRRTDPSRLQLLIGSAGDLDWAEGCSAIRLAEEPDTEDGSCADEVLARRYIDADCVDGGPLALAAYERADPALRARRHGERAARLAADGPQGARTGALPFHLERGTEPQTAGVAALEEAARHCLLSGFYHSAVEFAERGLGLVDPRTDHRSWWNLLTGLAGALAALDRPEEALARYHEARAVTVSPRAHMAAAGSIAVLLARHLPPPRRDLTAARAWANQAVAIADLLPEAGERAAASVFHRQALALLDARTGDLAGALRTIEDGLADLQRHFGPEGRPLDRARLLHNRSRIHLETARPDLAIADLNRVIELDPHHADHYFDRARIHRELGDPRAAVADYGTAIELGPPFPEEFYNRADTWSVLGEPSRALADLDRTLVLDPDHVEALISRSALRFSLGDLPGAEEDARRGLALSPGEPRLLCSLALVLGERGEQERADGLLTAALARAADMAELWANRAAVRFDRGDAEAAVRDLDEAIRLDDTPLFRFNRALGHLALQRHDAAEHELRNLLTREDEMDPDLGAAVRAQLTRCQTGTGVRP